MTTSWYEKVEHSEPLTQGDIILRCPILVWQDTDLTSGSVDQNRLQGLAKGVACDVIVMSQACDLQQKKLDNVILCPHTAISDHEKDWCGDFERGQSKPSGTGEELDRWHKRRRQSWKDHCDGVAAGRLWNLSMLNAGIVDDMNTEHRIVDFHEVYSVPVNFLHSFVTQRKEPRLRLLPPYREHLSQAFARYFMRVGLPLDVEKIWKTKALSQ